MKKMLTVLMTLAMVMALLVPAFAAETYTITIEQDNPNHKYEVYQIFTGDLTPEKDEDGAETGKMVLSNIEWGTGINADGKEYFEGLNDSAQGTADTLETTADAEAFADTIVSNDYLGTLKKVNYVEGTGYQVTGLEAGYYLIIEEAGSLTDSTEGYTSYILKVVESINVDPKDGETTFEKKVDDVNDSTGAEDTIEWHDSADHDIGDLIDFKLEATITENYDEYDEYYLALHDEEEIGLTFQPDTVKVYVDGVEITEGFTVVENPADGHTFDVVFANTKDIDAIAANSVITVTYKSQLNEDAILGSQGNVNKAFAEFSNNPNDDSHGKTKDDTVIVFTYEVVINKVKNDSTTESGYAPLAGADFQLEKKVGNEWVVIEKVETTPGTTFTFEGLDDGQYRLTETTTPTGYNTIDPVEFTVTADHDIEWTTQVRTEVLNTLEANAIGIDTEVEVEQGILTFVPDVAAGSLTADVLNTSGLVLPETGGIGTTIFYVVGALLVAGAAILLITKKRMSNVNS